MEKETFLNTLEEYADMRKEIKKLENRLDKLHKQSEIVSDVVQNGYKRHAVIRGVDLLRLNKIERLEIILQNRYDRLLKKQIEIEEHLDTLNSDMRQILEHRYIDDMSWIQIQLAMGYKHEDTARRKCERFFEKNM